MGGEWEDGAMEVSRAVQVSGPGEQQLEHGDALCHGPAEYTRCEQRDETDGATARDDRCADAGGGDACLHAVRPYACVADYPRRQRPRELNEPLPSRVVCGPCG